VIEDDHRKLGQAQELGSQYTSMACDNIAMLAQNHSLRARESNGLSVGPV